MGKRWWKPKNDHGNGILGALHAIMNIVVESVRWVMNRLHLNTTVGSRDLAHYVGHALVIVLVAWALLEIIGAGATGQGGGNVQTQ